MALRSSQPKPVVKSFWVASKAQKSGRKEVTSPSQRYKRVNSHHAQRWLIPALPIILFFNWFSAAQAGRVTMSLQTGSANLPENSLFPRQASHQRRPGRGS
jgi:hypothetical protein